MQGPDTVNDEFEVGFNQRFEAAWHRAEVIGRIVMVLFVVCAGLGLLGRGPFSHEKASSPDGKVIVDYEPVARHSTASTLTVHIRNTSDTSRTVELDIDQHIIEPMGFQHATPRPDSTEFDDTGARLDFIERPGQKDGLIRLALTPNIVGMANIGLRVDGESVSWRMLVVP